MATAFALSWPWTHPATGETRHHIADRIRTTPPPGRAEVAGVLARPWGLWIMHRETLTEWQARKRLRRMVASLTRGEPTPWEKVLHDLDPQDIDREWRDAGGYLFEVTDDGMLYILYDGGDPDPDIDGWCDPTPPYLGIQLLPEMVDVARESAARR